MLIVIAIISVLTALTTPNIRHFLVNTEYIKCKSISRVIEFECEVYLAKNNIDYTETNFNQFINNHYFEVVEEFELTHIDQKVYCEKIDQEVSDEVPFL